MKGMEKKMRFVYLSLFFVFIWIISGCNQTETSMNHNQDNHLTKNDDEKEKVIQVMSEYKDRFMELVDGAENDLKITSFQSKQELYLYFEEVMTNKLAKRLFDAYFQQRENNIYLIPTEQPV